MKKLMIIPGSWFQIPAVQYAKSQGYYVITCDYNPENPAHKLSDEYHNVSSTDGDGLLQLAKELSIDGILCFASDPAAPVAAYVSEKMGLPGNTYDNIRKFGVKHLWREFLRVNGFNVPRAKSYTSFDQVNLDEWTYPVMVKPVDSCGSKGITKVLDKSQMAAAYQYALSFCKSKIILVEEFIERVGPQIGGDGFYGKDRLEFVCYGDQVVDEGVNGYVPCGMTFPSRIDDGTKERISSEIERACRLSGLTNLSFNLEVMIGKDGKIYLMELGPRNGGNCIPEVIGQYTGVNMVALAVEAAMGKTLPIHPQSNGDYFAYYAMHSEREGVFQDYVVSEDFPGEVTSSYIFLKKGDRIGRFLGSNEEVGVLILKFHSREDMDRFFAEPTRYISCDIIY